MILPEAIRKRMSKPHAPVVDNLSVDVRLAGSDGGVNKRTGDKRIVDVSMDGSGSIAISHICGYPRRFYESQVADVDNPRL